MQHSECTSASSQAHSQHFPARRKSCVDTGPKDFHRKLLLKRVVVCTVYLTHLSLAEMPGVKTLNQQSSNSNPRFSMSSNTDAEMKEICLFSIRKRCLFKGNYSVKTIITWTRTQYYTYTTTLTPAFFDCAGWTSPSTSVSHCVSALFTLS